MQQEFNWVTAGFSHRYQIDVDPAYVDGDEHTLTIRSVHLLNMHTDTYKEIKIYPERCASWCGRFEYGERSNGFAHGIYSTPQEHEALVVASGAGYWLNCSSREVRYIESLPITQVIPFPQHRMLLITTWKDVFAYCTHDVSWHLQDIVLGDLHVSETGADKILVCGSADETTVQVEVTTGRALGPRIRLR